MAATVAVEELNGAESPGPTATEITSARFCTADTYNPGLNYPIPIPDSGFNYSYWKSHRIKFTGTFTQINNIRWYCDGTIGWTLGTNGEVRVGVRDSGDNGCPDSDYQQADGTQGTTGHPIEDSTNGHAYYKSQTDKVKNVENYTSSNPLVVDTTDYTSEGHSKHIVLQCRVANDATHGQQSSEQLTWIWDEIVLLIGIGIGIAAKLLPIFSSLI